MQSTMPRAYITATDGFPGRSRCRTTAPARAAGPEATNSTVASTSKGPPPPNQPRWTTGRTARTETLRHTTVATTAATRRRRPVWDPTVPTPPLAGSTTLTMMRSQLRARLRSDPEALAAPSCELRVCPDVRRAAPPHRHDMAYTAVGPTHQTLRTKTLGVGLPPFGG